MTIGSFIFISVNWLVIFAAFVVMYITTEDDTPGYKFVMRAGTGLCLLGATIAVIGMVVT